MTAPLSIAYLQEDTDLSGGVRVVMAQADSLIERGHRVALVSKGLPLSWRSSRAEWIYVDHFSEADLSQFDFVIGTFWTTVLAASELAGARAVHLCQGYEGAFSHYQDRRVAIETTYRLKVPKLVVSPHLVEICRQFHSDVHYIGQIVDDEFYRGPAPREHDPLRVLLAGPSQVDIKGIDDGYGAVAHARWEGAQFELIRVSPWKPSPHEPLEGVAEFHVAIPTNEMMRVVHSCDLFLGPNRKEEGFGLPAAEAMASGLACVLTSIPSYQSFDPRNDFALFGKEGDPEDLGEQLMTLAEDFDLRQQLRTRGRQVAEQFRAAVTAERLERFLLERHAQLVAGSRK